MLSKYEIESVAWRVIDLADAYHGLGLSGDHIERALRDLRNAAERDDAGVELMQRATDPINEHEFVVWSVLPTDKEWEQIEQLAKSNLEP